MMAQWRNLSDTELDRQVIYTGTYGWQFCDPLGRIWARTQRQFEQAMRSALNEEAKRAFEHEWDIPREYRKTLRELKDELWYVGPHGDTVEDTIADMEDNSRAAELRDDIRSSATGYVY